MGESAGLNMQNSSLGTATDPSGAVVPQVKVQLTNVKTGVQSSGVTNSVGDYLFEFLPPGEYRIQAEAPGFP